MSELSREQIAELVGCYFGLQQASNYHPRTPDPSGDGAVMLNALRAEMDRRMDAIKAKLPPGTVDNWPNI